MFLTTVILIFFSTELVLSDPIVPNRLFKREYDHEYNLNLFNNESTFLLVEIFSPVYFVDVSYSRGNLVNVLQANVFIPTITTENIQIRSRSFSSKYFWYRVINTMNVIPKNYPQIPDFQINVTMKNYWYTSIEFLPAQMFSKDWIGPMHYNLWVFPVFPSGQLSSWGFNFKSLNSDSIMSKIDSSLDSDVLKKSGFAIASLSYPFTSSKMQFTIANRKTYTNLVIIEVVLNNNFSLQYPPVIIYGCAFDNVSSSLDTGTSIWQQNGNCYLLNDGTWKIFVQVTFGIILLFLLIGLGYENLLSSVFTWLILSYVFCIGFHYIFWDINNAGDSLYYMICGICPGITLLLSITNCCICPTTSRGRIISNILCFIVIFYHFLWFIFQIFLSDFRIVLGVISGVSVILFILLLYFYQFMITFGTVFVSLSVALCGLSLFVVNSSSFPYLFIDFFNYILYRDSNVHYFTYVLYDDLFLFVSWGLFSIFIGHLSYKNYRRRYKEKSNSIEPIVNQDQFDRVTVTTYGLVSTQRFTTDIEDRLIPPQPRPRSIAPQPRPRNIAPQPRPRNIAREQMPLNMDPPAYTPRATAPPLYGISPNS